jgi:hypothetical protein
MSKVPSSSTVLSPDVIVRDFAYSSIASSHTSCGSYAGANQTEDPDARLQSFIDQSAFPDALKELLTNLCGTERRYVAIRRVGMSWDLQKGLEAESQQPPKHRAVKREDSDEVRAVLLSHRIAMDYLQRGCNVETELVCAAQAYEKLLRKQKGHFVLARLFEKHLWAPIRSEQHRHSGWPAALSTLILSDSPESSERTHLSAPSPSVSHSIQMCRGRSILVDESPFVGLNTPMESECGALEKPEREDTHE